MLFEGVNKDVKQLAISVANNRSVEKTALRLSHERALLQLKAPTEELTHYTRSVTCRMIQHATRVKALRLPKCCLRVNVFFGLSDNTAVFYRVEEIGYIGAAARTVIAATRFVIVSDEGAPNCEVPFLPRPHYQDDIVELDVNDRTKLLMHSLCVAPLPLYRPMSPNPVDWVVVPLFP